MSERLYAGLVGGFLIAIPMAIIAAYWLSRQRGTKTPFWKLYLRYLAWGYTVAALVGGVLVEW